MKQHNPEIPSLHCGPHRIALASSQTATTIPYLKTFNSHLVALYYHFANSAVCEASLHEVQTIMEEPVLRSEKAIHTSHDQAVAAIRRTLPSLLTTLEWEVVERVKWEVVEGVKWKVVEGVEWEVAEGVKWEVVEGVKWKVVEGVKWEVVGNDGTVGRGLIHALKSYKFVATIYLPSDVLPILSKLSFVFQSEKVDLTIVAPMVSSTVLALTAL